MHISSVVYAQAPTNAICILRLRKLTLRDATAGAIAVVQSGEGDLGIPVADVVGVGTEGKASRNAQGEDDEGEDGAGLLLFAVRALGERLLEAFASADVVVLGDVAVLVDATDALEGLLLHVAAKAIGVGAVDARLLDRGEGIVVEAVVVADGVLDLALVVVEHVDDEVAGVGIARRGGVELVAVVVDVGCLAVEVVRLVAAAGIVGADVGARVAVGHGAASVVVIVVALVLQPATALVVAGLAVVGHELDGGLQVVVEPHNVLGGIIARAARALVVVAANEEAGERHRLGPVAAAVVVLPRVVVIVLLHLDAVAAAVLDVAVVSVHPVLEAADVEGVHALRGQRVGLEEGGAARRTLSCCAGVCRCGHGRRGYRRQG